MSAGTNHVILILGRDRARAMLKALEALVDDVETSPVLMVAAQTGQKELPTVTPEVEALREALHGALYCTAGEG